MLVLRGDLVVLRPFHLDEFDRLQAERLASPFVVGTPSPERLRERIAHSGDWHDGILELAIDADDELIGSIDARAPERYSPPGVCEIGIELFPDARGAGRGTDAVRIFTDWLLENGYPRVQAGTDLRNAPMRNVFEKLGWEFEGVMRSFMPDRDSSSNGGRADYALYAITR